MSVSINGTGGITFADASTQSTGGYTGFRNRIINGAMMIDQRNAGASVTPSTSGQYLLDRFNAQFTQTGKFSVQQNAGSVTPPAGFTKYLGVTSLSSYSVAAGDYFRIDQWIEGNNVADLAWGTANASAVTLSFKVYSSLTGSFGGVIANSAFNRCYPFSYTVASANTWTTVSVTIPGDTTGTWLTDTGIGVRVSFSLGCGSSFSGTAGAWSGSTLTQPTGSQSVVGTNGATFYITGVQLEKGSVATPFEFRQYGTELALCQRYYWRHTSSDNNYSNFGLGYAISSSSGFIMIQNPVPMRVGPTSIEVSAGTTFNYNYSSNPTITANSLGVYIVVLQLTGLANVANGYSLPLFANNTSSAYIGVSAEL